MKIAVIGAGFTGLAAAYKLSQKNHSVTVFEKDSIPGGLALGFQEKNWDWSLERHYHHWFANDSSALGLAKELQHEVILKRPKTSVYTNKKIFQMDSVFSVLKFPLLSFVEKIRMVMVLAALKGNPFWKPLEKMNADSMLPVWMGKKAYELVWQPQLKNKFGQYSTEISLAWFWARIKKRTAKLAYPKGGFLLFANTVADAVRKNKGKINFETEVLEINEQEVTWTGENKKHTEKFDRIIVTLPSFLFLKIAPELPEEYKEKLNKLKGLGAINLVLRLKEPFLKDGTYWLSICEKGSPVMAVVEHTNFMDQENYGNEHIIYLGNYLPYDHPFMKLNQDELLKKFDPFLKKINPSYQSNLISSHLFKVPFAQPIIPINYSNIIPQFNTPFKNVFLANIQQVYPWDRGTNYAIELGFKIADYI